jgi:hypothetical protein
MSGDATTADARQAAFQVFVDQVRTAWPEADPVADGDEILRRAKLLERAHLVGIASKSARVRKLKAELRRAEKALSAAEGVTAAPLADDAA